MLAAVKAGSLPEYISGAFPNEDSHWNKLIRDAIAAHRAGKIDLIAAFAHTNEDRVSYSTQQFLGEVLPKLNLDQAQVLELVSSITGRSSGPSLPFYLSEWFNGWCVSKASRPWSLLEAIKSGAAPSYLRHQIWHCGLKTDRRRFLPVLIDQLENGDADERSSAANLLGRFDDFQPKERNRAIAALRTAIRREAGDGVVAPLRSLLHLASTVSGKEQEGIAAIEDRAGSNDQYVRSAIAWEMMFEMSKVPHSLANAAFAALLEIGPDEDDTIDAIDQMLAKTLNGPLAPAALALLDHLLVSRSARMKKLDSTSMTILQGDPTTRSALVSTWLRSSNFRHFDAVLDLCRGVGEDTPKFEIDMSGWSQEESLRAIRRASANLLAFPGTLASILVSALRTAPVSVRPSAESLIFDPLLLTFWIASRAYLETAVKSGPKHARDAIKRVLIAHNDYQSAIEAAHEITELAPSEHHRVLVDQKHREESRAISRNAMKMSIFSEIFPASLMLYGDAAVLDVHLADENSARQEAQMVSHAFSAEVLRYDMVEPFWARFRREQLLRGKTDK